MANNKIKIDIEEIGNNQYLINGVRIYAPNTDTAIKRYIERNDAS